MGRRKQVAIDALAGDSADAPADPPQARGLRPLIWVPALIALMVAMALAFSQLR
jgi:hypothetical protein